MALVKLTSTDHKFVYASGKNNLKFGTRGASRPAHEVLYELPKGLRRRIRKAARSHSLHQIASA